MFGDPDVRERIEELLMKHSLDDILTHFNINEVEVLMSLHLDDLIDLYDEDL